MNIAKLVTHWGLYLFYAIFAVILVSALIRRNRKFINLSLAYLKAQLIFSFLVVRILKVFNQLISVKISFFLADGSFVQASANVKVTIGGCGG